VQSCPEDGTLLIVNDSLRCFSGPNLDLCAGSCNTVLWTKDLQPVREQTHINILSHEFFDRGDVMVHDVKRQSSIQINPYLDLGI
jgi:hypothetical protein